MSRNGQNPLEVRSIPALTALPRPLFARTESLKVSTTTEWHSHPWAQLSYAIRGVLSVHTDTGRFLAPPQRAILIPPELPHAVISSPGTEMRSLYIDAAALAWARDTRLQAMCEALYAAPYLDQTLGDWSASLGLSEKTLTRVFSRETGFTFRAWRQRLRLLSALPLLEPRQRVPDVALACGYDSTSAFIAAFRKQTGLTPGDFLGDQLPPL